MSFEQASPEIALVFANTWGNRADPSTDRLRGYADVLQWALDSGAIEEGEHRQLVSMSERRPGESETVLNEAVELREAIFSLCTDAARSVPPKHGDLETLNRWLEVLPTAQLCAGDRCCVWRRANVPPDLRTPLLAAAASAADLLTSDSIHRLRECAAPDCSWLFLDSSRGGRRRWCDMSTCGNRAKARRYYERHRGNT